jgi:plastocyanin
VIEVPSATWFRYFARCMSSTRVRDGLRRVLPVGLFGLALGVAAGALAIASDATAQETKVAVKGRLLGGEQLLNPVWEEAKDPKNHRYTFRQPSTTVGAKAKKLSAYLPKEVCIAAIGDGPSPSGAVTMHLSGGRTTPVTVVIGAGQNVQFVNHDPFPHTLYSVKAGAGSLAPEKTTKGKQRTWKPPGVGVYEVRDKAFPSVRSWVVVEPKVVATGHPNLKNEFVVSDLAPGSYELRAYFSGKPVGKPLPIEVTPQPVLQQLRDPLVLAEKKKKEAPKKEEGKE